MQVAVPYDQVAYRGFIAELPNQLGRWTTVDVPTSNVTWHNQALGGGGSITAIQAADAKDGGGFIDFTPGLGARSSGTPAWNVLASASAGYTIMFWMRTGTIPVNGYSFFDLRSNAAGTHNEVVLIRLDQGGVFEVLTLSPTQTPATVDYRDGSHLDINDVYAAEPVLENNQWHFVAIVKSTVSEWSVLYIDGDVRQEQEPGNGIQIDTVDWGTARIEFGRSIGDLGAATLWPGDNYAGGMADFAIIGDPLTSVQVRDAYRAAVPKSAVVGGLSAVGSISRGG